MEFVDRPRARGPIARGERRTRKRPEAALRLAVSVCLAAALSVGLPACYSFSGSSLPGHIKTIAVPTFENDTLEPGLEREMTEAAIRVLLDDGRLDIAGTANADAVVDGRVVRYDRSVFGLGGDDRAEEYRVTVQIAVTVRDRVKGRDLWSKEAMIEQSLYRLDGTGQGAADEDQARAQAVAKLAEEILANTLEEW